MGKSLKGKELGKGISQRKSDGRYVGRFTKKNGKREVVYGKTITEVTKKLREAEYLDEKEDGTAKSGMTLDEWFDVWLKTSKVDCLNSSKRTYVANYERVKSDLGWMRLSDISATTVQLSMNKIKTDKSRAGTRGLLVDLFERAVENDLIVKNPAHFVKTKISGDKKNEKRVLGIKEEELLLSKIQNGVLRVIIIVGLDTGMRIGEILGLCFDAIDLDRNEIEVKRSLTHVSKGSFEFHPPKTKSGYRRIPLTKRAKAEILIWLKKREMIVANSLAPEGFENLVFVTKHYWPIYENNVRNSLMRLVNRVNRDTPDAHMDYISPHELRHTFATRCIAKGMKPKVLQRILGHSSIQLTMDLYCHVEEDTVRSEMDGVFDLA